jgi:hypothetical protein
MLIAFGIAGVGVPPIPPGAAAIRFGVVLGYEGNADGNGPGVAVEG